MAKALHVARDTKQGSTHAVGVGDLRVMLFREEDVWYAQGLEIDYLAQGSSLEHAQHCFEKGLRATIAEHLKLHGHIRKLLSPAPASVWDEFYAHQSASKFNFTHVGRHELTAPSGNHVFIAETHQQKSIKTKRKRPPASAGAGMAFPFDGISYLAAA